LLTRLIGHRIDAVCFVVVVNKESNT
jgi:hypothetical protein